MEDKEFKYLSHNLWSLGLKSYEEYLNTYIWKCIRNQVLEEIKECKKCGYKKGLQVHHLTYKRLGSEMGSDLIVLCKKCHKKEHDIL